jgi:hypothetical protein
MNTITLNPLFIPLITKRLGHLQHTGFTRRIRRDIFPANKTYNTRDVYYFPRSSLSQQGFREFLARDKDGADIDIHHEIYLLVREIHGFVPLHYSSAVEQNVGLVAVAPYFLVGAPEVFEVPDVAGVLLYAATGVFDVFTEGLAGRVLGDFYGDDVCSGGDEGHSHGCSQAAGSAGYDGGFALQGEELSDVDYWCWACHCGCRLEGCKKASSLQEFLKLQL